MKIFNFDSEQRAGENEKFKGKVVDEKWISRGKFGFKLKIILNFKDRKRYAVFALLSLTM